MKVTPLKRELFNNIINDLKVPSIVDNDYLYDVYEVSCSAIEDVSNLSTLNNFTPVNHVVLILYAVNETLFAFKTIADADKRKDDDEFFNKIASIVADKYITNEQLQATKRIVNFHLEVCLQE